MGVEEAVETLRVDVLVVPDDRLMADGLKDRVGPLANAGVIVPKRFTVPLKPLTLFRTIVGVAEDPTRRTEVMVLLEMEKPTTLTFTVTMWVTDPLVPVIVTV